MADQPKLDTLHHLAITVSELQETFIAEQHPPHFAVIGDPAAFGEPQQHRDGTRSVYLKDPSGNKVEILALP